LFTYIEGGGGYTVTDETNLRTEQAKLPAATLAIQNFGIGSRRYLQPSHQFLDGQLPLASLAAAHDIDQGEQFIEPLVFES